MNADDIGRPTRNGPAQDYALGVVVIVAMVLAGCLGNENGVAGGRPGEGLMAIVGIEHFDGSASGGSPAVRASWTYYFYDAQANTVRVLTRDSTGAVTDDLTRPAYGRFSTVAAPITSLPIDSRQVSQLVASSAGAPATGTSIIYSLETLAGYPVWSVRHATPAAAPSFFAFNGNTGSSLALTSLPHLQGISMTVAREVADTAVVVAAADAFLVEAASFETRPEDALQAMLFWNYEYGKGYVPTADLVPLDGLTTWWAFLYYSPSQHQVWPIFVYANLVPMVGDPISPQEPPNAFVPVPDEIHDALDFAGKILGEKSWASYRLTRYFGLVWRFEYGDGHRGAVFDAQTGETVTCYGCSP